MTANADRELVVWFRDRRVGVLRDESAVWTLVYEPDWIRSVDGFDLSPALPKIEGRIEDGGSRRPVQWFFDNLLPEDQARTLLANEAHLSGDDAFGLLEYYGAESAGALTLLPHGRKPEGGGLKPLPDEMLSRRIRGLPRHSLSADAPKRMSIAGAQHKLPVVLQDGQLYEPIGATPSTEILKPDHFDVDRYPHSTANEWFCMQLAQQVGLPVPASTLRYVPEPIYLVHRFDRAGEGTNVQRLHVVDACQLLSLDRTYKYRRSTADALSQLVDACREKARTRVALYRWGVFNALIGNGDAHLKNLSFFVNPAGIELTPHYDLVSTASYAAPGLWRDAELSLPMGTAQRFGELRRADVLDFGGALGLPAPLSGRFLDELLRSITNAAATEVGRFDTGESPVQYAGEQRQVRLIVSGVLRDMREQLA
jgi:serine/threonine-protein kinase HipA